jgi:cytosine/adenosine deaminase-related metal-dependent hydrolase
VSSATLLRGGTVLTLGVKTPNLAEGDVLIDGDRIAEVGRALRPPRDAVTIDCTDTIVMPGFVDTHRHTWTSLFRNAGESIDAELSAAAFQRHYGPDDVYAATLIGLLGAAAAGITTVVDWVDLASDDALVDAAAQAHADAGVRSILVVPGARAARQPGPREIAARLADASAPSPATAFGSVVETVDDVEVAATGWPAARAAGMRIHAHAGAGLGGPGVVAALGQRGLLGPDVTLIHHTALDAADVRAIAESGAAVSLAPSSEMASGHGSPPIQELMDRDVKPGLGVDHERVAPGDLFAQMHQTISLQHATVFDRKLMGKGSLPKLMSTRDVIRFATVEGARVAGLSGATGSIEPGMQADVIVLRTDRPNIWPINDAIGAVVWGMDTSNVDHVFVGGRPLVTAGALTADVQSARASAIAARERVAAAAGLSPAGASA